MKKVIFVFKVLFLSIFTSSLLGCLSFQFSRLTEPHTAQTLGKGNNEVTVSVDTFQVDAAPYSQSLEYTRGLSDNFDLGVFLESHHKDELFPLLIGLEGKYQFTQNNQHTLSLLFGGGLNKGGDNEYGDKKITDDLLIGYFSYIGPVYSFKLNEIYELALNVRINQSYSKSADMKSIAMEDFLNAFRGSPKELPDDVDVNSIVIFYSSINMSHTWWIIPNFGTTLSLATISPLYYLDENDESDTDEDDSTEDLDLGDLLVKLGLSFHFNF